MRLTSFLFCLAMLVLAVMVSQGWVENRPEADGGAAGLDTYADIAAASYRDSHQVAIIPRAATATLIAAPPSAI